MQVEQRQVSSLVGYAKNSRTHSAAQVAQLAASIREFGFTNPILIDADGVVIAGHGRLAAAQQCGMDTVPVIVLGHLNEQQRRAYVIADNKIALNSGWDAEMLRDELQALHDAAFDVSALGFGADELLEVMTGSKKSAGNTDPDDAPAARPVAVSSPGDVWRCGQHRVMCGDATVADQVRHLVAGQMVDVLLTDPPYNVAYSGKTKDALQIKNDSMPGADFRAFLSAAFSAADAVMKPGAVFYIWHADLEGFNFRGACHSVGWAVRQCLIWKKNSLVLGRQDYQSMHEPCLYGWKEGAAHLWASDRKQTTVLEFDRPSRNAEHPTMKPVALFEYQLLNNTKGGDVVLDSFGGSGTTLIAAEKNGRIARLMELDPVYCDVIVRRWQQFTGKRAVHERTGAEFPPDSE